MNKQLARFYEFGAFRIDTLNKVLLRDGEPLQLKPKAYEMLLLLVVNGERLIPKEEFLDTIWHDSVVEEANISQHIYTLRKVLDDGNGAQFIETIPKRGYRFTQAVRLIWDVDGREREEGPAHGYRVGAIVRQRTQAHIVIEEEDDDANRTASAADVSLVAAPKGTLQKYRLLFATSALALVSIAVVVVIAVNRNRQEARIPGVRSLAVLPLKNLSPLKEDAYLSTGISETLTARLAQITGLTVRPSLTVRKYEDPDRDAVQAGREQQVEAVIDGSMQKQGDNLRVSVQLIDVKNASIIWTGNFDEKLRDTFKLQDALCARLMEHLDPTRADHRPVLVAHNPKNFEAYEAYLKGRYYLYKYSGETQHKAVEHFKQAVALDPDYAPAYAGLSEAYFFLSDSEDSADRALEVAKANAEKAIALDDSLAAAHVSLGLTLMRCEWDYPGAEREFKRAIELQPNDPVTHDWYGWFLLAMGRYDESISELRKAQQLDPLSLTVMIDIADYYYGMRQYDQAIDYIRRTCELDPGYVQCDADLGYLYVQTGKPDEAIAALQRVYAADPSPRRLCELGYVYAAAGRSARARELLVEIKRIPNHRRLLAGQIALIYATLGDNDAAFEWLDIARQHRAKEILLLKSLPWFDPIRSDPRFNGFLRSINLG